MKIKAVAIALESFAYVDGDGYGFMVQKGVAYSGAYDDETLEFSFTQFAVDEQGQNKRRFDVVVPHGSPRYSIHRYANGKTLNG